MLELVSIALSYCNLLIYVYMKKIRDFNRIVTKQNKKKLKRQTNKDNFYTW